MENNKTVRLDYWLGPIKLFSKRFEGTIRWYNLLSLFSEQAQLKTDGDKASYYVSVCYDDAVKACVADDGVYQYRVSHYNRNYIDLTLSYDEYLALFSGKTRSTLKRKLKKFTKVSDGEIDWCQYQTVDELMEFHHIARGISKNTYQEKLFDAGIPSSQTFIENMTNLAQQNNVRAYILFLNKKPIAYLYCPIEQGVVVYGFLGFMPEYAKHSPGTVLQLLVLKQLFSDREYKYFDFTEGDGAHKRLFSTASIKCANILCLPVSISSTFWLRTHQSLTEVSKFLDWCLAKANIKGTLKKMLRKQGQ